MMLHKTTAALCLALLGLSTSLTAARAESWGAISVDLQKVERSPYYGIGGGDSEAEATRNAMKFCAEAGGKECKTVVTYNQCGAYAANKQSGGGWGKSTTKKTAETQAMAGCNHDSCKVLVSDCN
jgi:hypothetical protein